MDLCDFVTFVLLAFGGEVRGKTKLQKLVYFVGALTGNLGELGYRAHFYGPYSDDVARAVGQLRAIGAVDQNETDCGRDRSGFEVKRMDYRLNESGREYAERLARRNRDLFGSVKRAIDTYKRLGDRDYMELSVAAKTYFLLGQRKEKTGRAELAKLATRFGWHVSPQQVTEAAEYLAKLDLVEVA